MTKYTRSIQKLTTNIKDIFAARDVSIDTLSIVMILAATMPTIKFNAWLDNIEPLNCLNAKFKEINCLRFMLGDHIRDYIILSALQAVNHDVSSDELQQFIRADKLSANSTVNLDPALTSAAIDEQKEYYALGADPAFTVLKEHANEYLLKQLNNYGVPDLQRIVAAYIHCRRHADSVAAYFAVMHAMSDLLRQGGITEQDALVHSDKLARHALQRFIHTTNYRNAILHAYSKSI